jgi:hypothetical protein
MDNFAKAIAGNTLICVTIKIFYSPNLSVRTNNNFSDHTRLAHKESLTRAFSTSEYVILDDFWSLYPRYTWGRAGVFLFSCIFHNLEKSAETWCNCSLCRPELV